MGDGFLFLEGGGKNWDICGNGLVTPLKLSKILSCGLLGRQINVLITDDQVCSTLCLAENNKHSGMF